MIKNRTKTQTRRIWKKRRAKPGSIHKVKTNFLSTDYHCKIHILDVRMERLGDITPEDADREGGYTVDEYKKVWTDINGSWQPDLEVYVVDFELVE